MKHEGEDLFFLARTKVAQGTVAKCTTAARIPHYVPCGSIYVGRIKINNWGRQTVWVVINCPAGNFPDKRSSHSCRFGKFEYLRRLQGVSVWFFKISDKYT